MVDPVLASQLARDLDRLLAALAYGEQLLAGLDQAAAAIALQEAPRYSPLRTLLATAATSTEHVQKALRDMTSDAAAGPPHGCAPPVRGPGDGDAPDPSPGPPPAPRADHRPALTGTREHRPLPSDARVPIPHLRALLVPAGGTPVEVIEVAETAIAISDALGGHLLDDTTTGELPDGRQLTFFRAEHSAPLPANPTAAALAARTGVTDPHTLAQLRGPVLVLGLDCGQDLPVPGDLITLAHESGRPISDSDNETKPRNEPTR